MTQEIGERRLDSPITIEICSTPFKARDKLLVHNSIEDMITDRLDRLDDKIRGHYGLIQHYLPSSVDANTRQDYLESIRRVQDLLTRRRGSQDVFLIQDGALASMIFTDYLGRIKAFPEEEADSLVKSFVPYVQMEDLVILTLVNPRACMERELYPPELPGYDEIMKAAYMSYKVFNESARRVLDTYSGRLPRLEFIELNQDELKPAEILIRNADVVFNYLGLPSVDEWSRRLEAHPELQGRKFATVPGANSLAGLTRDQIINKVQESDLAKSPEKRKRSQAMTFSIINLFDQVREARRTEAEWQRSWGEHFENVSKNPSETRVYHTEENRNFDPDSQYWDTGLVVYYDPAGGLPLIEYSATIDYYEPQLKLHREIAQYSYEFVSCSHPDYEENLEAVEMTIREWDSDSLYRRRRKSGLVRQIRLEGQEWSPETLTPRELGPILEESVYEPHVDRGKSSEWVEKTRLIIIGDGSHELYARDDEGIMRRVVSKLGGEKYSLRMVSQFQEETVGPATYVEF